MSLTQPQRIQISGEMVDLPLKIQVMQDSGNQLEDIKTELQAKDSSIKIFFDKHSGNCIAYQNEHRWSNGTTYTAFLSETQIVDSAKKLSTNIYFPIDGSWINFQPRATDSDDGSPTSNSSGNELEHLTKPISSGGSKSLLDFFINGQSSGNSTQLLNADYSPGFGYLNINFSIPIGTIVIVGSPNGGKPSGLFRVSGSFNPFNNLQPVEEIVTPEGVLQGGWAEAKQNISAFSDVEKNTLTAINVGAEYSTGEVNYQNVLSGLANLISNSINTWITPLDNQRSYLVGNTDSRSPQSTQRQTAISDIDNTKAIISIWQALPQTGVTLTDSRYVNTNLITVYNEVLARETFVGTRSTQIITALGNVGQSSDGTISGTGLYSDRFKQLDLRLNLAGGSLTEYYGKDIAKKAVDQIVGISTINLQSYESELKMEPLTENGNNTNTIIVASVSGFSNGDTVFVTADSLTELTGTITNIDSLSIELSIVVPNTYTKDLRARIYKQL